MLIWVQGKSNIHSFLASMSAGETIMQLIMCMAQENQHRNTVEACHSSVCNGRYVHHRNTEGLAYPCVWMKRLY